jgi:DNA-binding LytR/AlgR family response regulator
MSDKLKIAVCDDEKRFVTIISASVESIFKDLNIEVSMESFFMPGELLDKLKTKSYDLIFLDISMPGMDGIELSKTIGSLSRGMKIVFVSSRLERVFDTFPVQPFGFVRKNRFLEDLSDVINRFAEQLDQRGEEANLAYFKGQNGTITIDTAHLKYIECHKNTQLLHVQNAEKVHKLYLRMETLETELKHLGFLRIHKGYLVNSKFVKRFNSKTIILMTGEELPVGRSRHHEAMGEYLAFISREGTSVIGK